ncbi:MAG: GNAT family N-acetyltransferase [Clostridia bacterium]|nr:GNAT family N-acetyltransferase [Clostridia bacterium]
MSDIRYTTGTAANWPDIIDFANYVFSQAHRPHDFKTLLPGVYGRSDPEVPGWHFIAVTGDGHIRALVADKPQIMTYAGKTLKAGCVGTVSVHPYARSEGHMKRLMSDMISDAQNKNYDMLILGGQRQRYNYFGFEKAGYQYSYNITRTNVRHALGDVDPSGIRFFEIQREDHDIISYTNSLSGRLPVHGNRPADKYYDIMHNWSSAFRWIEVDGRRAGYIVGDGLEIVLEDESDLKRVIKALLKDDSLRQLEITCAPHEKERMTGLSEFAESTTIGGVEMVRVLNWKNVIETLLHYKSTFTTLEDGEFTLSIDDMPSLTITVENGNAAVRELDREPDLVCSHMMAQRNLFGLEGFVRPVYKNYFPLPFYISSVDTF